MAALLTKVLMEPGAEWNSAKSAEPSYSILRLLNLRLLYEYGHLACDALELAARYLRFVIGPSLVTCVPELSRLQQRRFRQRCPPVWCLRGLRDVASELVVHLRCV